ncbi:MULTISPECIES: acyl-CoA thioesterase II [unclassified Polaromonas]|uniref:acyl-CoA thioesterase n=1 Tax=unclassified Polaromonas TaxID=2638319 RepID=UPI000F07D364|nr:MULTISPECIES: thioesterase family protein [unclassified Polaromonas]AYQ27142.1 thioesterase family protein [Polaromonas sp. SP1]QGJ18012.1 thioesterase family protein [Polaromonas sp. Pch-P]
MTTSHPLDEALRLEAAGNGSPGTWQGHTHADYWNMVGPFGGTTAATALRAILMHPALLGEPVALTVNYAAAVAEGAFTVTARPVRTNRSTQHWAVELSQADAAGGALEVVMTATAVTAARRETWSQSDTPMPAAASPDAAARLQVSSAAWTSRYDLRPVRGVIPPVWDGSGEDSLTQLWVRDDPPRPLDFPALAALSDVFYPRVWLRRATRVPAGTVSITTYFHADSAQLAQCGDGFLFGQARAQAFRNGFFDQTAQLWSEAGVLLATSTQIVYYKE